MADEELGPFGEKYELIEKIASGGMADVYRARAKGMAGFEKILVIKRIQPELAKDEEFKRLFIDEARITVTIRHVNIVQVFDIDEYKEQVFMTMEYVHGLDLFRLLSKAKALGPFPIPLALFIIAEVLKALQFAHEKKDERGRRLNIVHCDISPQNVLISYAGEVKLADFGISKAAFQAEEVNKVIRGKYAYMSPEQVEGRQLDGRTDLFSLTIVLYEALTGRRLFKAKERNETLARVRRAEVPSPRAYRPEISEALEELLFKGLARKASDRFATAGDMLEAVSSLMLREGHRATNNDLASFLKDIVDVAQGSKGVKAEKKSVSQRTLPPSTVVVLSTEAYMPPRSMASPKITLSDLSDRWMKAVIDAKGEVWETHDGSMLVVWQARTGLRDAI
ncbi:MAG: serine/threonine-protein kinase, partial [Myxococcota bacterium]|nr:serine/threonine-protein kinase [Myxococcota bacterium]